LVSRKQAEESISDFWEKNKMFERSVEERPLSKQFVFYDGPPFATGLPHYGHILGLTSKDVFPRYWTMKGYRVERKWGWDCHGLPIENIVEKALGIKDKREIEKMGIEKFNETCREKVFGYVAEWKKTIRVLGKWIDFDNSYKTMDNSYMESVWSIFKNLYDRKLIYEGKKILIYCPRCQTPLANSEIQMDNSYKDVTEKTATVAFKLKQPVGSVANDEETFILAWTTTPWTLIGNVALAINPKTTYVKVNVFGKKFILAKSLVENFFKGPAAEILEEFLGGALVGKEYVPLYEMNSNGKKGWFVIDGGDEVTSEDGTGIVHMAAYGEFDYKMIKKNNLPVIQHVGNDGKLVEGPSAWIGLWFKKVDAEVLSDLESRGILVESKSYTHSYPFCYRCETPLIYNPVDSWFVDIQSVKSKLIECAQEINWYPDNIKEGRFKYILDTAPDWTISRNRFWATAIPVWKCSCGNQKVFGSVKELKECAVTESVELTSLKDGTILKDSNGNALKNMTEIPNDLDLHKHIVDKILVKCECGKHMSRIPEVLDCWFESAAMPYAAKHYPFENESWFEKNYPADFISEYIAQVRAWFYYMHVLGVLVFDKAPFKNVVVSGTILAKDGSKMSKSKNNFTPPELLFDEIGGDALRFYLMSSQLMRAQDLNLFDDAAREVNRKLISMLVNIKQFYTLFAGDNSEFNDDSSQDLLDKWLVSKTHKLIETVTKGLEDYNTLVCCTSIIEYVDELSTWYVRRSRDRIKSDDANEKKAVVHTLGFALDRLSKLIAPITPFIAEEIYQGIHKFNFSTKNSVHLELWPSFDSTKINNLLETDMGVVREVVTKALDERKKANIAVKQPLLSIEVSGTNLTDKYADVIADELNVKKVLFLKTSVNTTAPAEISVKLDTTITKELELEGLLRELVRQVNSVRKEKGLTIGDKVSISFCTASVDVAAVLDKFSNELKHSTQSVAIKLFPTFDELKKFVVLENGSKFSVKETEVQLFIEKV
jgi:isoleucyl-tRNA synthetase